MLLASSVLLSRVLGYARDALVAARFGAGRDTDVYYAAFTLPDLMSYLLAGGALSLTFLPLFTRRYAEEPERAWRTLGVIATTMGLVVSLAIALTWVLAPWIVPWAFPGFDAVACAETVRLTRIVLPAQLAFYLGGLASAAVLSRERFLAVALAPLVYNVLIIAGGLALGGVLGIAGFSVGALVGAFVGPFGLVLLAARRGGLRLYPRLSFRDADLRQFVVRSFPVMLGVSLITVDEWLCRYFASGLAEGTITWLQNARRLMLVPVAVLGQAAGQAALPFLSRLVAENRHDEAGRVLGQSMAVVTYATLLAGALLWALAVPSVALLYQHGAYTAEDAAATAAALRWLALGVAFWALQSLAARGFYATEDTWTPVLLSTTVTILSIPMYAWLAQRSQHEGLALATTLGVGATALVTALLVRQRLPIAIGPLLWSMSRSALIALLSALAVTVIDARLVTQSPLLRLVAGTLTFVAVAGLASWLAKAPELRAFTGRLKG